MAYSAQADVAAAAGGSDRLTQLTDVDGLGQTNAAVLAQAQSAADAWIDSYAQRRLATPLNPVPPLVRTMAAQETVYRLMQLRQMVPDWAKEQHDERHVWLQDLAKGLVSPGVDPEMAKSSAVSPANLARSEAEDVSRSALRGFW